MEEGGREGGRRAAAASPRGLYKASLITAAWSLLASIHLPLTLIKFWVAKNSTFLWFFLLYFSIS